jgi:hypothetical protein
LAFLKKSRWFPLKKHLSFKHLAWFERTAQRLAKQAQNGLYLSKTAKAWAEKPSIVVRVGLHGKSARWR